MSGATHWLKGAFTENLTLKVLAFVLAVGLVYFKRDDQVTEVTAQIPVQVRHPKDRILMTPRVNTVDVTVRGDYAKLRRFRADEIPPVVLNLAGVEDGQISFDPRNIQIPPGLTVSDIRPGTMVVKFEGRAVADVPVKAVFEGELPAGYRVIHESVTPKTVKVIGAKSVISGLELVKTKPVGLSGRKQSAEVPVGLSSAPAYSDFAVDNQTVRVKIEIKERRGTRVVTGLPITVNQRDEGEWFFEASPGEISVTLNGSVRQLADLNGDELKVSVETGDLGQKKVYTRAVTVQAPEGVTVAETRPSQITLVRRQRVVEVQPDAGLSDAGVE